MWLAETQPMKLRRANKRNHALTLIETTVLVLLIAVLLAILLPALAAAKRKPIKPFCSNNLRQISLANLMWASDNNSKYPMEVSATTGSAMEFANAGEVWKVFQVMSNYLGTPKVLICPADTQRAKAATNFSTDLKNKISYFAGLDAKESDPQTPLAGDDNLVVNGVPVPPGILNLSSNSVSWTQDRHCFSGNVALVDGSVQSVTRIGFNSSAGTLFATNRLAIP